MFPSVLSKMIFSFVRRQQPSGDGRGSGGAPAEDAGESPRARAAGSGKGEHVLGVAQVTCQVSEAGSRVPVLAVWAD